MNITIGEIANILLPYTNLIEMNITNDHPFLKAYLNGSGLSTRIYMYVVQTGEHTYAVCDSDDDKNGKRYFPTGSIKRPLMPEKDIVNEWFNGEDKGSDPSVKIGLTNLTFEDYLLERLFEYGILIFDPKDKNVSITSLDFKSLKIRRIVDRAFADNHYRNSNIGNLIDLVMKKHKTITFPQLKEKEIKCIYAKLKDRGLDVTFKDCEIVKVKYIFRR